jgi:hypothetical protein
MGEEAKVDVLADIGSFVRTWTAFYGGYLTAHGAPASDVATFGDSLANIVVGIVAAALIQVWSHIQKRVALKKALG